jgi:hypothetical protein
MYDYRQGSHTKSSQSVFASRCPVTASNGGHHPIPGLRTIPVPQPPAPNSNGQQEPTPSSPPTKPPTSLNWTALNSVEADNLQELCPCARAVA